MTAKTRIKQLERTKAKDGTPLRTVIMFDDAHGDKLAKFDGVEMTQAEAEQKAAELPDSVLLIHVKFARQAIKDGDE